MSRESRFELDLPAGWFRIDLDPATRERSAEQLVDAWVQSHPQLADYREALISMLASTAERAARTNCIFAAAGFGRQPGAGPTYAGLTVRLLSWPGSLAITEFLERMAEAARADPAVTSADIVQVGGRPMVLVRQKAADEGAPDDPAAASVVTSFVVPMPTRGVFANLEFSSPESPAPEHTFAHIAATAHIR